MDTSQKLITKKVARGKSLPQTKLSDRNIEGIRGALKDGYDTKFLQEIYHISKSHISRIKNRKRRAVLGSYPGLAPNDVPVTLDVGNQIDN